jgi:cystathionine beta-lyase
MDREENVYPRYFNTPNQRAVVDKLCALEGAGGGVLFSSGMAAISTTILTFARPGDHLVVQDDLYGGTHAFISKLCAQLGLTHSFVATDADAVARALTPATKLVIIESPSNPLLAVIDIRRVSAAARAHGALTMIDNTFATPINQTPLALGIDIVVHSGTKYLGGHGDLCCGAALTSRENAERIRATACQLGGSVNAITCHLLERSLKTLALRVTRQCENAAQIADALVETPGVAHVNYPGLVSHPGHELARSQMRAFGAMLSFELAATAGAPDAFLKRLRLIRPAVSLGGVDTTICAPSKTSHVKISAAERERIGISDRLLRLSVGIEAPEDLIADLQQALA